MSSFGRTLRTKVAPVAFMIALTFLTVRACRTELAQVEFRFDFGARAAEVSSFRVDVFRAGDDISVLTLERADMSGTHGKPVSIEAQLDTGTYRLLFEVHTARGIHRFERAVETTDQATISLALERDLGP
jgi:hypothetical protein